MAIIKDFNDQDQKQNLSGESGALGTGASTGGSSAGPAAPTGGAQGSGWTNLQSYLGANQGQAGGLANQITQDADKQVDEFKKTDVSGSVAEIGKAAKTDDVNAITGDVAKNADKAKSFLSSGYGGAGVDTYTAGIRNAAKEVNDTLGNITNQGYQKSTLQRLNNTPNQNYSSGFAALDSFLVSADPNAKAKLKMTQGRSGEVDQTLNAATGQIQSADTAARSAFDANKQRLRDAAKAQAASITGAAQARVEPTRAAQLQGAHNQAADILGKVKGDYNDEFVTDAEGVGSTNFFNQNANFGVSDVISDSELAALNSLAGIDPTLGITPMTKGSGKAVTFDTAGWEGSLRGIGEQKKKAKADADAAAAAKAAEDARKRAAEEAAARDAAKAAELARWKNSALANNPPPSMIDFFTPWITTPDAPSPGQDTNWTPPKQPGNIAVQPNTSGMAPQPIATDQPAGMVIPIDNPDDPFSKAFNK